MATPQAVFTTLTLAVFLLAMGMTARQRPLIYDIHDVDAPLPPPHHQDEHARSLLADDLDLGMLLFLRRTGSESIESVQVAPSATVRDLYREAAQVLALRVGSFTLSFQSQPFTEMDVQVADTGLSQEGMLEVDITVRDDVEDFLALFDEQSLRHKFSKQELARIRSLNEEKMQTEEKDIAEVVKLINTAIERADSYSRTIDTAIVMDEQAGRQRRRITQLELKFMAGDLKWQHLPTQTKSVKLSFGRMHVIDLSNIECAELEELEIGPVNNKLSELRLHGIEKCVKLQKLRVFDQRQLSELNLKPLAQCRELKTLDVFSNPQLSELNLEPLAKCRELNTLNFDNNNLQDLDFSVFPQRGWKYVSIDYNPFGHRSMEDIKRTLLVERGEWRGGSYGDD